MSPSSAEVTYRPAGPGHRTRIARVDLSRIPDPEAWLTNRLGPLAQFVIALPPTEQAARHARIDALAFRLTASMQAVLGTRRAALEALAARLEAAAPAGLRRSEIPNPTEESKR